MYINVGHLVKISLVLIGNYGNDICRKMANNKVVLINRSWYSQLFTYRYFFLYSVMGASSHTTLLYQCISFYLFWYFVCQCVYPLSSSVQFMKNINNKYLKYMDFVKFLL